ncbi:MAG: DNA-processing protein DprA [Pseudomonadota bacterium]|nr:DNA-processing protein DprA [Pseudomonadota bacterium]
MRRLPTFIENKIPRLAQQLSAAGGLLFFEYRAEVAPRPYYFPERKRMLNGLSELTVIFEASEKSGSLINARLAVKQDPDTCAVLGPVTSPLSMGCHRLFRQGAVLVICVAEVAEELGWSLARSANVNEPARDERALTGLSAEACQVISEQSRQFDEIVGFLGSDPQQVSQCLMELQPGGFVRQGSDGYIRVLQHCRRST